MRLLIWIWETAYGILRVMMHLRISGSGKEGSFSRNPAGKHICRLGDRLPQRSYQAMRTTIASPAGGKKEQPSGSAYTLDSIQFYWSCTAIAAREESGVSSPPKANRSGRRTRRLACDGSIFDTQVCASHSGSVESSIRLRLLKAHGAREGSLTKSTRRPLETGELVRSTRRTSIAAA